MSSVDEAALLSALYQGVRDILDAELECAVSAEDTKLLRILGFRFAELFSVRVVPPVVVGGGES